jgi:hypothetical protein
MLVGDPNKRTVDTTMKRQNCYRCYTGPNFGGDTGAPCQDNKLDTQELPKAQCKGGIRSNVLFPTCWDGVNLDSPDHKSHVGSYSPIHTSPFIHPHSYIPIHTSPCIHPHSYIPIHTSPCIHPHSRQVS